MSATADPPERFVQAQARDYAQALAAFYDGQPDEATLRLLAADALP